MIDAKHRTWKDFCQTHQIAERAVPLFALQSRDVIVSTGALSAVRGDTRSVIDAPLPSRC